MGRRFNVAGNDLINIGSTGLAGLNFTFGTFAVVATRATSPATNQAMAATNQVTGACYNLVANDADQVLLWDNSNQRNSTTITVPASTTPFVLATTKATGTATARVHKYNFGTGVWQHEAMSGTTVNSATNTSVTLGSDSTASPQSWDGEIWAVGLWQGLVMTDSVVKRLAKGRWLDMAPTFYVQWSDGREDGDMTRSLGRNAAWQTSRTGTTRGVLPPPAGFQFGPRVRRR